MGERMTILEMPIYTWMPMNPGRPYLAKIGDTPMLFQGPTAFSVAKAADQWRRDEVAKVQKRGENARRRAEAARVAREARKMENGAEE